MEKEDYPAYLKNQSYEDLVSISHTINKENQAGRYAMLMTEMAERDKLAGRKVSPPQPPIEKPVVVAKAVGLLCVSLAIVFASLFWLWYHEISLGQTMFTLVVLAWLTYKIDQGRNWARITFLVMFLLGTVILILLHLMVSVPLFFDGILIIQTALQTFALLMLFSRDARLWFGAAISPSIMPDDSNRDT